MITTRASFWRCCHGCCCCGFRCCCCCSSSSSSSSCYCCCCCCCFCCSTQTLTNVYPNHTSVMSMPNVLTLLVVTNANALLGILVMESSVIVSRNGCRSKSLWLNTMSQANEIKPKVHPKVHYRAIQCYYVDFVSDRKWRRGDSRPQRRPTSCTEILAFLQLFGASWSVEVGVSVSCPCKVIPLSDEVGLWDKIKEVRRKRHGCPWTVVKDAKQACRAPRIDLGLHVLVRQSFKPRNLSGAVVCISQHSTIYTAISDKQDTCCTRSVLKMNNHHYFPHTKMALRITE